MTKYTTCSLLIACLLSTGLFAQTSHPDSLRVERYYTALSQHCYSNLDSTFFYLDRLLSETRRLDWTEEQAYAYLWGILCTGYHDQIDSKYELLSAAETLMAGKGAALKPEIRAGIDTDLRMHWGDYYMETGGYNQALDIYEGLSAQFETQDSLPDEAFQRLVITNQYLATIHRLRGSYRESIDYAFRALRYEQEYYARQGKTLGDQSLAYSRIANAYWLKGERPPALHYHRNAFNSALRRYQADPGRNARLRKRLISMGLELAGYYRELERADSALFFLDQVSPYTAGDPLAEELRLERIRLWQLSGRRRQALDTLQLAIRQAGQGTDQRAKRLLLVNMYGLSGRLLEQQQDFARALETYQQALDLFADQPIAQDPQQNPSPTTTFAPRTLLQLLTQKTALLAGHPPDGDERRLRAAWATANAGMDLVDSIRVSYTSDYDKQYLLEDSYALYELALDIAHRLGDSYAEAALSIMERSKAVALYAAVRDLHARTFAGLPPNELERLRRLQYQLAKTDTELEQAGRDSQSTGLREKRSVLQRSYRELIRKFEKDYPDYYRLKYEHRQTSLRDPGMDDLLSDRVVIEYFTGRENLYACVIHEGRAQLHRLPWSERIQQWAGDLRTDIHRGNDGAFREKARALYEALLAPLLPADGPGELVIIPDGVLGYLPFDVLLTDSPPESTAGDFRTYSFVLKQWTVSQHFSLRLLREMRQKGSSRKGDLLAVAPHFPGNAPVAARSDRNLLGELVFNREEARRVLQFFDGLLLSGAEATEKRFTEQAPAYRMYHIASHAVVDDQYPHQSYIAFSRDGEDEHNHSRMYGYEILAQPFPADLIVLSACETAVGKVVRGEGIMSLTRAFSYAGARSLITSLWNVNDQSGSDLMNEFYRQLRAGKTKDEALRLAKLSYLENAPDNARTHPRYWAAFIATGNMDALSTTPGYRWWFLAAAAGGLFLYLLRRKMN